MLLNIEQEISVKKYILRNFEIDYFSMVNKINAIMVQFVVAALVKSPNKSASKYGRRSPLNKHGHTFYQSQISLNSF